MRRVLHDLCAFTSRDFALTQCQRPVFTTRALFGSRSAEGVHPAYVVNTLTILHEANGSVSARLVSYHLPRIGEDEERRSASAYVNYDPRARGQEASLLIVPRCDRPVLEISRNTKTTCSYTDAFEICQASQGAAT